MKKKIKPSLIVLLILLFFTGAYNVKAETEKNSFLNIKEILINN